MRWLAGMLAGLGMHPVLAELPWGGGEFPVTAGGASATAGPTVAIHREASGTRITFKGLLQAGTSAAGPWADVVGADTPLLETSDAPQRFYRSRDMGGVFEEEGVVRLVLQGPLQRHFELAFAGLPDGIFPPVREKPWFPGSVRVAGEEIPATLRVRGNSSLQECPFPKLKFKVAREDREGTPFAGAREVKVGSHCAEGGRGSIGRLREEAAVYREAMAYEVMHLLGFLSPRVERARVTYRDTSPPREGSETGWTLTREALLLDDAEVVAERLGGRALGDDEITALTHADFDAQTITDLRALHVLLGNWDFALSVDGRNLWNTEVIERADGRLIPVAGDFDLASWVTGEVQDTVPQDYLPALPLLDRRARYELEVLGESVTPAQFAAMRERFSSKRVALESLVQGAQVDEIGRTNALRHLTVFQESLAATRR